MIFEQPNLKRITNDNKQIITGGPKVTSHFLKSIKAKPNRAKKISYISNERPDLGVFLLMKNSFIV